MQSPYCINYGRYLRRWPLFLQFVEIHFRLFSVKTSRTHLLPLLPCKKPRCKRHSWNFSTTSIEQQESPCMIFRSLLFEQHHYPRHQWEFLLFFLLYIEQYLYSVTVVKRTMKHLRILKDGTWHSKTNHSLIISGSFFLSGQLSRIRSPGNAQKN